VRAWSGLVRVAPLRTYTRLIRVASGIPLPRQLRAPIFGAIAQGMGIDLSETAGELAQYRCFGELFARSLRPGVRPIAQAGGAVVSPVDGSVSGMGQARQASLIQAKGIEYPMAELVASDDLARALDGGTYLTLYLRPRDYHRIHTPLSGRVVRMSRLGRSLFPVKPYMVRTLDGLYVRNERVVFELLTEVGRVALVCVAAAGVGNISTAFDDVVLRPSNGENGTAVRTARLDLQVDKGQEVARFNLGSTVIMVFPQGKVELAALRPGETVRMGQEVATMLASGSAAGRGVFGH